MFSAKKPNQKELEFFPK
jgi:hypothetical protein